MTSQPSWLKKSRVSLMQSTTSGSIGIWPEKSALNAIFKAPAPALIGGSKDCSVSFDSGACSCAPLITLSRRAQSSTVLAMGPAIGRGSSGFSEGTIGTRPGVVLKPTTLQKLAGFLSDPPKSVPSQSGTKRAARAAAAPPELPPAVFDRS
jgi:hypothetical protein